MSLFFQDGEEGGLVAGVVECPVMFVGVSSLPREADVEWHYVSLQHPHTPSCEHTIAADRGRRVFDLCTLSTQTGAARSMWAVSGYLACRRHGAKTWK